MRSDRITRIESDPATWLHRRNDWGHCEQCGDQILLNEGDYLVVTLHLDIPREEERERLCSGECYRQGAHDGMETGW